MTEQQQREFADRAIATALQEIEDAGVPYHIMMDRIFTVAGTYALVNEGQEATTQQFRRMADNVAAGALNKALRKPESQLN